MAGNPFSAFRAGADLRGRDAKIGDVVAAASASGQPMPPQPAYVPAAPPSSYAPTGNTQRTFGAPMAPPISDEEAAMFLLKLMQRR
jgi:hypothetical protein